MTQRHKHPNLTAAERALETWYALQTPPREGAYGTSPEDPKVRAVRILREAFEAEAESARACLLRSIEAEKFARRGP